MTVDTNNTGVRWAISAAWATKQHDCTLAGIAKRCHAGCCKSPSFWPPKAFGQEDHKCGYLGDKGCTLSRDDRPVLCLVYPLVFNNHDKLVMHQAAMFSHAACKGAFKNGPMLIDSLKPQLVHLFGEAQFERVRADLVAGRDSYFDVPSDILAATTRENAWAAANMPPLPRSEFER